MTRYSKLLLLLAGCCFLAISCDRPDPRERIKKVMDEQVVAWNKGDLRGFMTGYWMSDSLAFTGRSNITYGWEPALERYEKAYTTKEEMGVLSFHHVQTTVTGSASAFTVGAWKLDRATDTLSGRFTLVWQQINGSWVIVADHSS